MPCTSPNLSHLYRAGHQSGQTAVRGYSGASQQIIFAKKKFCKNPIQAMRKTKENSMSEPLKKRICPFLKIQCLAENCMAWIPEQEPEIECKKGYEHLSFQCRDTCNSHLHGTTEYDCNTCSMGRLTSCIPAHCRLLE